MSDEELRAMFAEHGEVSSCIIMRDDDGASKGFGFVNFEAPEQAGAAVAALNGECSVCSEGKGSMCAVL